MHKEVVIIIPARLKAVRLPNKPLLTINGKPMIVHVAECAKKAALGRVYVACCGNEIKDVVESYGIEAIITPPELPSGTDRVHAAYEEIIKLDSKDNDNSEANQIKYIVNLQGDMPYFPHHILKETVEKLENHPDADISTPVIKITSQVMLDDHNTVKAIINHDNKLAIDFTRYDNTIKLDEAYKHLGIYVYKTDALKKFVSLPTSPLENDRRLEQLRALENNMKIVAKILDHNFVDDIVSVDTNEDLIEIKKIMKV